MRAGRASMTCTEKLNDTALSPTNSRSGPSGPWATGSRECGTPWSLCSNLHGGRHGRAGGNGGARSPWAARRGEVRRRRGGPGAVAGD